MARRSATDRLLSALASLGGVAVPWLPSTVVRWLASALGASVCVLLWPVSSLRRRCVELGLRVSPAALGACHGRNLATLLGARCPLKLAGGAVAALDQGPTDQGLVLLGAHLGPWEAGARELARRGFAPAVVAAPWPGLPRTAKAVARLRGRSGVKTFFRGRAGWRGATRHLRAGGCVVVLVDSSRPTGAQRRPGPFVDGPVAAPDAVVAWAQRQGAALWVAAGRADGFDLHVLPHRSKQAQPLADQALSVLRAAVLSQPSQWGWVRALAGWALLATLAGWGCNDGPLPPPLPLEPSSWIAVAEGVRWDGPIPGHGQGQLEARRAEGSWQEGAPYGRFQAVVLNLRSEDGGRDLAILEADTAEGSWPDGPLRMQQVRWRLEAAALRDVPEDLRSGSLDQVTWLGQQGWRCGGCLLEQLGPGLASSESPELPGVEEEKGARRVP